MDNLKGGLLVMLNSKCPILTIRNGKPLQIYMKNDKESP